MMTSRKDKYGSDKLMKEPVTSHFAEIPSSLPDPAPIWAGLSWRTSKTARATHAYAISVVQSLYNL
jgi:hypothetical protein